MTTITTDHRRIELEPDFPAHERAAAVARRFIVSQVVLARELLRIDATRTFLALGCASIEEYGVRIGLTARDARQLVDLGRSLKLPPAPIEELPSGAPMTVEEAVLAGSISVEKATLAGRLLSTPGLLRDGEDPVQIATANPVRRVQAIIRERQEEIAQEQPVTPLALAVTPRAKEDFARARAVASDKAGTMLTEGETFAVVVTHYLDREDPLRTGEGTRRVPDTSELPGQRYIPAEVRRAIRARSEDRCEVPACPHRSFLAFAHIDAHREHGSREEDNLLRLCSVHHVLLDAGRVRFAGWDNGHPQFRDRHGRQLEERAMFPSKETATAAPT